MASIPQPLNAHWLKSMARQTQMGEVRWRADLPTVSKQSDICTSQPKISGPALQTIEHILQATGGGKITLQLQ
ncbi:Uncharacterised protein [Yersinia enterocolitica]|nr:Uncharacterised protein [Yersinia enterocolitica]